MIAKRQLVAYAALVVCTLFAASTGKSLTRQSAGPTASSKTALDEEKTLQPADLFPDFPEVKWGMSFSDARKAIEKTGVQPVAFRDSQTELVWDGNFNGVSGRATIFCKPDTGVWEVAVITFALEKQKEIFEGLVKKVTARHGAPKQVEDDSYSVSKIWRLKDGVAIEVRAPKDPESPIVDIHWVKK